MQNYLLTLIILHNYYIHFQIEFNFWQLSQSPIARKITISRARCGNLNPAVSTNTTLTFTITTILHTIDVIAFAKRMDGFQSVILRPNRHPNFNSHRILS